MKIIFYEHIDMFPISQNALTSGTYRNKVYKYTEPLTAGEYYHKLKMKLQIIFDNAMQVVKDESNLIFILKLPISICGKTRYDLDNFAYPIFTSSEKSGIMKLISEWKISKSYIFDGFDILIARGEDGKTYG